MSRRLPREVADRATPDASASDATGGPIELELLYQDQQHLLVRFFTRHRASSEEARDLVQETFLRLTRLDLRAGLIARPEAYLRQIARNLLRDRFRAGRRNAEAKHLSLDDCSVSDHDEIRRLEARDGLRRFEAAMARMKPRTREIFMAHRIDGLSYAEIAAATGLSIKGVEKQISRALAQLDRALGPRG